jgi:hypothetical protein
MTTSGVWTSAEITANELFGGEETLWNLKTIEGGYIITQVKETE